MKKLLFIKNALILTATSLILRLLGIFLKIWLASEIGSEGIGLYQLVFSFYMLAAVFATSGISTAVTRLVSDELVIGSKKGIRKIMLRSFTVTAIFAFLTQFALLSFSDFISLNIINDIRAAASLKILSFSLLFMGISSCIKGYFIAGKKTFPPASSQIFEQLVRIGVIMFHVKHFALGDVKAACAIILFGDTVAEICSCIYLYIFYRNDYGRLPSGSSFPAKRPLTHELLRISMPISGSKYVTSVLRTLESTLVPRGLISSGMNNAAALSTLGAIRGMALPVLFFPSSLLNSITTLLIPELAEAVAKKHFAAMRSSVSRALQITTTVGFIFGAVFFFCGNKLGLIIYKDAEVGFLLTALAPLVPLMYLDSLADGLLKGLDRQGATFRHSVTDSVLRIVLIYFLLPIYGRTGFIAIMYLSNVYTCLLNVIDLIKVTQIKINLFSNVSLPLTAAIAVTFTAHNIINRFSIGNLLSVILLATSSLIFYFGILYVCFRRTK